MELSTICSVSNATLNRFFSLHYLLPFVLAALSVAHLMALHEHGSNNPNGVTSNGDRFSMHPYFIFKDLVTIFLFLLILSIVVFYYPNIMGQHLWPNIILLIVNIIFICAICWKDILKIYNIFILYLVKIYNKTIIVSGLFLNNIFRKYLIKLINPIIVKYYYKIYNQQITNIIFNIYFYIIKYMFLYNKYYLLLVGISESLRTQQNNIIKNINLKYFSKINCNSELITDNHNNEISLNFKQWFAGLTDGDGYIYVNKKGYVGFEITLPAHDEKVLRIIQNKFGGNVHARSGMKTVRYRTQRQEVTHKIIKCLNGLVINNVRLVQLHKACLALNIPIKIPIFPNINSAYISGLLDSDGTINIYKQNYNNTFRYQLTISISNKSRSNIEFLLEVIGGQINFDKSFNGHYKWVANSKLLHFKLYNYFLKNPPKTIKLHRTFLIKEFHELNSKKVYLENNKLSMNYKVWKIFITRWDNKILN
jgi:ubiquinol-cytochrome c reductase cytochrome b subunit